MKFKAIESESKMLSKLEFSGLPRFSDQIKSSNVNIKYLKMDYIDGVNLKEDMKQVYHEKEVVEWSKQLCDILNYLHHFIDGSIYYLDLKPANIIKKKHATSIHEIANVTLIDFGCAKQVGNDFMNARGGYTKGFAAPEQYNPQYDEKVDERSDIYGLGATMFYLLTNQNIEQFTSKQERYTYLLQHQVSRGLAYIICKCIEERKKDRFQSARELYQALCNPNIYDPLLQKKIKNKMIIFMIVFSMSIMSFIGSFLMHHMEKKLIQANYEYLVARARSNTNITSKQKQLYEAITLIPLNKEAYQVVIQSYIDDEIFDYNEQQAMFKYVTSYMENIPKDDTYADLCYQIARLYIYYYDDESNGNLNEEQALLWYSKALKYWNKQESKEYLYAKIYYELLTLNTLEASYEGVDDYALYKQNWENIKILVDAIDHYEKEKISDKVIGRICERSISFIQKKMNQLKKAGINQQEIQTLITNIEMIYFEYQYNEQTKSIFDNVKDHLDLIPNTLKAVYED